MTPTNRLRFVEREVASPRWPNILKKVRVLQQWWEEFGGRGEWRDVPLEEEG